MRLVTAGATGCKTVCVMMLRLKGDGHADRERGRLGGAFAMGYLGVRPHGAYFGDNEALGDTAAAWASLPVTVPGLFGLSRVICSSERAMVLIFCTRHVAQFFRSQAGRPGAPLDLCCARLLVWIERAL